jgi:hypothetical protein
MFRAYHNRAVAAPPGYDIQFHDFWIRRNVDTSFGSIAPRSAGEKAVAKRRLSSIINQVGPREFAGRGTESSNGTPGVGRRRTDAGDVHPCDTDISAMGSGSLNLPIKMGDPLPALWAVGAR